MIKTRQSKPDRIYLNKVQVEIHDNIKIKALTKTRDYGKIKIEKCIWDKDLKNGSRISQIHNRAKDLFNESKSREHVNWRQYLQEIQRVAASRCLRWNRGYAGAWTLRQRNRRCRR